MFNLFAEVIQAEQKGNELEGKAIPFFSFVQCGLMKENENGDD